MSRDLLGMLNAHDRSELMAVIEGFLNRINNLGISKNPDALCCMIGIIEGCCSEFGWSRDKFLDVAGQIWDSARTTPS